MNNLNLDWVWPYPWVIIQTFVVAFASLLLFVGFYTGWKEDYPKLTAICGALVSTCIIVGGATVLKLLGCF